MIGKAPIQDQGKDDVDGLTINSGAVGELGRSLDDAVGDELSSALAIVPGEAGQPKAYLKYIFLNQSYEGTGSSVQDVSAPGGTIALDFSPTEDGYLYVYVVNESQKDVFFDDLTFSIEGTRVVRRTDYYPFGAVAKVWDSPEQTQQEAYRFGYQGDYSEKDEETGWNHFEARQYDPIIGRWLSVDPARQFASPYVGMGNDPVNGVDQDGGSYYCTKSFNRGKWL